jgi:hypothetical protein
MAYDNLSYCEGDSSFMNDFKHDSSTMWLYTKNEDKDKTNVDMLIQTSRTSKVLFCHYETNCMTSREQQQQPTICVSHFHKRTYDACTNIYVGARVAMSNMNILPEIGLYNGAIGTLVEIVYENRPEGPNDKEHNHLPDYVVVDYPNLKLPPDIQPSDQYHKTVSLTHCS